MKNLGTSLIISSPYILLLITNYLIIRKHNFFFTAIGMMTSLLVFLVLQRLSVAIVLVMKGKEDLFSAVRFVFNIK